LFLEAILKHPKIYRFFQSFLANKKDNFYNILTDYLKKNYQNYSIIDIGCGDAKIASFFDDSTKYVGFDISKKYIESAKKNFPHFEFHNSDITKIKNLPFTNSVFLLIGVIHHISDKDAKNFITFLKSIEGSTIICIDPVKIKKQHPIAKLFIKLDRGEFIRTKSEYEKIFVNFTFFLRDNLLLLPYNHIISVYNAKGGLF